MHARAADDGDPVAAEVATAVGDTDAGVAFGEADATGALEGDVSLDADAAAVVAPGESAVPAEADAAAGLGPDAVAAADGLDEVDDPLSPQAASAAMASTSNDRRTTTNGIGDPPLT